LKLPASRHPGGGAHQGANGHWIRGDARESRRILDLGE